jgi:hypothetical protein
MAQPISPLAAYNDFINQQITQLQAPQQQGVDPMAMLALAQGFLSPTRTGSFGESVGYAAGAAMGPLSKARQADQDRIDKIAKLRETQVKLALEQQRINDLNTRAAAGGSTDPILDYSRAMAGLEREASMIGDPNALDLDTNTAEGLAEKNRRLQERAAITNQMKALRSRYFNTMGAGTGAGAGAGADAKPADDETPTRRQGSGSSGAATDNSGFLNSSMAGNKPSGRPSGAAPAPAGKTGRVASDLDLENARTAYQRGAPIQAIIKRFKENGITGITPEDITGGK